MSIIAERNIHPDSEDYFLSFPPRRPKDAIADYVESNGILVPRRFDGLDAAIASRRPFVIRSEHPQDYQGVSGLLNSYHITPERLAKVRERVKGKPPERFRDKEYDTAKVLVKIGDVEQDELEFELRKLSQGAIVDYLKLTRKNPANFYNGIAFSYWEQIGGINRSIVADNTIDGRYYIFSRGLDVTTGRTKGRGYCIVDDGKVVTSAASEKFDGTADDVQQAIELYESVKSLDKFDSNHRPIVEAQSVGGQHYFLQYHRARDFQPATHVLDRKKEEDEIEPILVRGATPPEGIVANIHFYYGGDFHYPLQTEEGAMEVLVTPLHTELSVRRRKIEILTAHDLGEVGKSIDGGHLALSQLFKPAVSLVLDRQGYKTLKDGLKRSEVDNLGHLKVRVVSDGNKAYIKRLGINSEPGKF